MATAKKTTAKTTTTARSSTTTRTRKTTPKAKVKTNAPVQAEFLIKRANNGFVLDIASDTVYSQLVFTDAEGIEEVISKINNTVLEMYKA